MSFGGSNGSTGVTAHVHNNSVGEGGALSNTLTKLDSMNLSTRITIGV